MILSIQATSRAYLDLHFYHSKIDYKMKFSDFVFNPFSWPYMAWILCPWLRNLYSFHHSPITICMSLPMQRCGRLFFCHSNWKLGNRYRFPNPLSQRKHCIYTIFAETFAKRTHKAVAKDKANGCHYPLKCRKENQDISLGIGTDIQRDAAAE